MAIHTLLNVTKDQINAVLQNTNRNYLRFSILKRSGKKRIIDAPAENLKILQRKILDTILYEYLAHPISHGFVQYRSPKTNALMHKQAAVVLNVDIKDFFPTITEQRVLNLFKYLTTKTGIMGYAAPITLSDEDCTILAKLCTHKGKVPQGASTSPMISNLICLGMDKELKALAETKNCTVTRYADDITISSEDPKIDIGAFLRPISTIVHKYGFILNKQKTRILRKHKRQEVTGVVINEGTNASKRYRRQVRAQVHNYVNSPEIDISEYRKIRGKIEWISSLNPVHGQQLLKKLGSKKLKNSTKSSSNKTASPH
ncbi:MAG: retron St85 family RNA-directed DNA polymerase [Candidatus Pacearchaeota archaeon]